MPSGRCVEGQHPIPEHLDILVSQTHEAAQVRERIRASGREIRLEIDGGVKVDNIAEIAQAGADTFVAGSAIFGSGDYVGTIAAMRAAIDRVAIDRVATDRVATDRIAS